MGALNLRWFISFLSLTTFCCIYAAVFSFSIYKDFYDFYHVARYPWHMQIQYLIFGGGPLLFSLLFFIGAMATALSAFTGYHLFLIVRNVTTLETGKRSEAKDLRHFQEQLLADKKFRFQHPELAFVNGTLPFTLQFAPPDLPVDERPANGEQLADGRERIVEGVEEPGPIKISEEVSLETKLDRSYLWFSDIKDFKVRPEEEILDVSFMPSSFYYIRIIPKVKSIYSRGVFQNFKEVFFPFVHYPPTPLPPHKSD